MSTVIPSYHLKNMKLAMRVWLKIFGMNSLSLIFSTLGNLKKLAPTHITTPFRCRWPKCGSSVGRHAPAVGGKDHQPVVAGDFAHVGGGDAAWAQGPAEKEGPKPKPKALPA